MEPDKNKMNQNTRPNSEERTSPPKEKPEEKWKTDAKRNAQSFAMSAGLTLVQGALFALGGMAARSAVDRVKSGRVIKADPFADNLLTIKRPSANA